MKRKERDNRSGTFAILFLVMGMVLMSVFCSVNVAAESPWASTWNGIIEYGVPLAAVLIVVGVFAALLTFSKDLDLSPRAKMASAFTMIGCIFMAAMIGYGVVAESEAADISADLEDGVASFNVHMDNPNATAICDFSDSDSLLWQVEYNSTSGLITNATNTIDFYFTLTRADQLDQWAYTEAAIVLDPIDSQLTDGTTGAEPWIISKTTNLWDVNWLTRAGADIASQSLTVDSLPTTETRVESYNITIVLNDLFITALHNNGRTYGSFDFVISGETWDCQVQLYNDYA